MTDQQEILPAAPGLFGVMSAPQTTDELPLPTNGPYFVLSKEAVMVHRNFHFGRVIVPINQLEMLNKLEPKLVYDDILVPKELVEQAWSFFRAILKYRKSEAMVDIVFDHDAGRRAKRTERQGWDDMGYRLFVPPQRASHGGVEAQRTGAHYKGQIVGTIHSHCDFGAFHSGTDTHDADGHDGLHITIGFNNHAQPQIATMISVAGERWNFEAKEIWGDTPYTPLQHPVWWERYVKDPLPANKGHVSTWQTQGGKPTTVIASSPRPANIPVIYRGPADTTPKPVVPASQPTTSNYLSIHELLDSIGMFLDDAQLRRLEDAAVDLEAIINDMGDIGFDLDYTIQWDARTFDNGDPDMPDTDDETQMPMWIRRMLHEEEYIPHD